MRTELPPASARRRRLKKCLIWFAILFPLYVLSTGPVAWATNDGQHPRYLPEEVNIIYLPLIPLTQIECIGDFFYWYTAIVWDGWPAGYTTL